MIGSIRIIGGKYKGRKLPVLSQDGLRPTTDRVKETLFNWLMPVIQDATCLDCFSGSGSLAFEALSRGAKCVVMLEKNKQTAAQLKKNSLLLKSDNLAIHTTDSLNYLNQSALQQFDIVFIDPPFHQGLASKTISYLETYNWLQNDAYIYVETEINYPLIAHIPTNWQLHREKKMGQVHSYLFKRENP